MIIVSKITELRIALSGVRRASRSIGFVPTMGALHDGHLSLVERTRAQCDFVVMSIFVNPTQFNSADDLEKYPRTLDADASLAKGAGVDLLFVPSVDEIYGRSTGGSEEGIRCSVRAGSTSLGLCGASRPGHFDGVVTVVSILFNLVNPDVAVFGEKDFQQLAVIRQMVSDLHFPVRILPGAIIRDSDGLALSSRNVRLSAEDRFHALYISKTLFKLQELANKGERSVEILKKIALDNLEKSGGLNIDYIEIVNSDTLAAISRIDTHARCLIAAFVGEVRLIDNIELRVS